MEHSDTTISELDSFKKLLQNLAPKLTFENGSLFIFPDSTELRNVDIINCIVENTEFKKIEASKDGNWRIFYCA